MRTDLGNVVFTLSEGAEGHAQELVGRHRAFPEVQARGQSTCEVFGELIFLLKHASGWASDAWHSTELAQAIFDVESLLMLITSTRNTEIKFEDTCIYKIHDNIYYTRGESPDESALGTADHGDHRPGLDEVLIYSIGRRTADRRRSKGGEGPIPGQPMQRRSERRKGDQRQFNRISLIARVP